MALENNLVTKSGSWFNYGKVRLGQGQNVARKFLLDNPDLTEEIKAKILALHGPTAGPKKSTEATKSAEPVKKTAAKAK